MFRQRSICLIFTYIFCCGFTSVLLVSGSALNPVDLPIPTPIEEGGDPSEAVIQVNVITLAPGGSKDTKTYAEFVSKFESYFILRVNVTQKNKGIETFVTVHCYYRTKPNLTLETNMDACTPYFPPVLIYADSAKNLLATEQTTISMDTYTDICISHQNVMEELGTKIGGKYITLLEKYKKNPTRTSFKIQITAEDSILKRNGFIHVNHTNLSTVSTVTVKGEERILELYFNSIEVELNTQAIGSHAIRKKQMVFCLRSFFEVDKHTGNIVKHISDNIVRGENLVLLDGVGGKVTAEPENPQLLEVFGLVLPKYYISHNETCDYMENLLIRNTL